MQLNINALRGMPDTLPGETKHWSEVEEIIKSIVNQYGYSEIRTPILESIEVFKKIGNDSDIIGKEMYQFNDQNGETIALRPEGTAGIVRAAIQHSLIGREPSKLWYLGPMFRYERPQKGRYRQFTQFGVEAFGYESTSMDVEILMLNQHIFDMLGLTDTELEINFIGSSDTRKTYRNHLTSYLSQYKNDLDADSIRRLSTNPMRILDSKDPNTISVCESAPKIIDCLNKHESARYESICSQLDDVGLNYKINPMIVRGLDYYNDLVFEFTSKKLGSQSAVSAGGRFDNFIPSESKYATPAIGFSIGMERLMSMLICAQTKQPLLYAFHDSKTCPAELMRTIDTLRRHHPDWTIILAHQQTSYNAHMKKAQKIMADVIIGLSASCSNTADIYDMRKSFNKAKTECSTETLLEISQKLITEIDYGE